MVGLKGVTKMPNKLTDEEIVKALEYCYADENNCKRCPYMAVDKCHKVHTKDVLDLINRLKEENERLKNAYKQCAWERDIFAEDMKEEIKKDCSYLMLDIKTIKAEAYKEFAERLKEEATADDDSTWWIANIDVDNLLKELVGDKP